jgi:hypothetical protein
MLHIKTPINLAYLIGNQLLIIGWKYIIYVTYLEGDAEARAIINVRWTV